jgi:hypothetical protein
MSLDASTVLSRSPACEYAAYDQAVARTIAKEVDETGKARDLDTEDIVFEFYQS